MHPHPLADPEAHVRSVAKKPPNPGHHAEPPKRHLQQPFGSHVLDQGRGNPKPTTREFRSGNEELYCAVAGGVYWGHCEGVWAGVEWQWGGEERGR